MARRRSDYFELVGVVDDAASDAPRQDRAVNYKPYEGVKWMTEEELLDSSEVEAVFVEKTNADLPDAALRCAEHGFHMHMDKPGGQDMAQFEKIVNLCRSENLVLQMGYMYRMNPALKLCRRALREGWMGDVFEIDMTMNRFDNNSYREYISTFKGGAMYNFGGHLIDFVVSVLGRPERVTPFLKCTRDDGVEDNTLAVLEYAHANACVHTSITDPDSFPHRRVIVRGTKGTFELCPTEPIPYSKPMALRFTFAEANSEYAAGTHNITLPPMNTRYDDHLIEFARIVRGEIENPYPYEHELLVQEVLLAACGCTEWR
ncbi:MAG: Gfo/Idh/MocA family oxidoreductase [Planctomycetota bacterium]